MKLTAFLIFAAFLSLGCAEKPEPVATPPSGSQAEQTQAQTGSDEGVIVISPAAGLSSPVTGSDSVAGGSGGGGSAAGQAAKDQAKRIGGSQSQGSLGAGTTDDDF